MRGEPLLQLAYTKSLKKNAGILPLNVWLRDSRMQAARAAHIDGCGARAANGGNGDRSAGWLAHQLVSEESGDELVDLRQIDV